MKFLGWLQFYCLNVIKYLRCTLILIEFIKFLNITFTGHEFYVPLKFKTSDDSRLLRRDTALLSERFSLFWEIVIPLRLILITTYYHIIEDLNPHTHTHTHTHTHSFENSKCHNNTSGENIFFIPSILWDSREENFCLLAVLWAVSSASLPYYRTESAWRPIRYAEKQRMNKYVKKSIHSISLYLPTLSCCDSKQLIIHQQSPTAYVGWSDLNSIIQAT